MTAQRVDQDNPEDVDHGNGHDSRIAQLDEFVGEVILSAESRRLWLETSKKKSPPEPVLCHVLISGQCTAHLDGECVASFLDSTLP